MARKVRKEFKRKKLCLVIERIINEEEQPLPSLSPADKEYLRQKLLFNRPYPRNDDLEQLGKKAVISYMEACQGIRNPSFVEHLIEPLLYKSMLEVYEARKPIWEGGPVPLQSRATIKDINAARVNAISVLLLGSAQCIGNPKAFVVELKLDRFAWKIESVEILPGGTQSKLTGIADCFVRKESAPVTRLNQSFGE